MTDSNYWAVDDFKLHELVYFRDAWATGLQTRQGMMGWMQEMDAGGMIQKNTGDAQCLRVLQIPVTGSGIQTVDKNDFLAVTHKGNTLQAIT